jgi:hypothetical protein
MILARAAKHLDTVIGHIERLGFDRENRPSGHSGGASPSASSTTATGQRCPGHRPTS